MQLPMDGNRHWKEKHVFISNVRLSCLCVPHHGHFYFDRDSIIKVVGVLFEIKSSRALCPKRIALRSILLR